MHRYILSSAYRFEAGEQSGARDYVDPHRRKIVLHPFSDGEAMAHAFGHMLGLADRYYTVWYEKICS